MTVKVLLFTRNPQNNERFTLQCEFTRIPTVGEHIWIVLNDGYNADICFKVVYVAHLPFIYDVAEDYNEYSAKIYAVRDDQESLEDLGFYI